MKIVEDSQRFGVRSLMFASDEVKDKFIRMYKLQHTPMSTPPKIEETYDRLFSFADLVVSIRKELGYKNTNLSRDDVGRLLITDYDTHRGSLSTLMLLDRRPLIAD